MNITDLARPEIRQLAPYASARALAGRAGILLNANENPWPPADDGGLGLNRYPDPQPAALKQRLASHYGVDPGQLLITRGSDEGIDLLIRVFCRVGTDCVLVCPPCFGMYALSAQVQGAAVVSVPLIETADAFILDHAGIRRAPACRLYFLCSPNNPTGNGLDAATVLALADRVAGHGLVVLDEAYIEFSDRASVAAAVADRPNLVVLRTLSKAFALAGCRIGALIADADVIDLLRRIIAPYPLPTPAVAAAETALSTAALARQAEQLDIIRREKQRLTAALDQHPAVRNLWPGEANFVLVRVVNGADLVRAAADAGIRLRDQSRQPGLAECVRITVGAPEENRALIDFLKDWRP